jgi:hypothetical protein
MTGQPHRGLRDVLRVFSVLVLLGSLLMILSGRSLMMRVLLRPPESEVKTLLLFAIREMGGLFLMLSVLLFLASRDPVRNAAIIDAGIVGLVVLAVTPLISLETLDIRRLYPGYLIWGRSLVRLALAVLLFWLRPREGVGGQGVLHIGARR